MNIALAADGSNFTKKALVFLVANRERLLIEIHGGFSTLHVVHVRPPLPLRASSALRTGVVAQFHREEAEPVQLVK